jgi:hypothetical protein
MDAATRHLAQHRFRIFWILNAVPVAFLLDDILILYGIRNGVPEPALAALASFVQLTMPFMLLGRVFTARFGLARGWAAAYRIRYTAVLILIAAPFVESQMLRTGIVLAGGFIFAMFRAVGVINMHPLNGEITSEEDRGRYLHGNFALFNGTYLLAVGSTILATRLFDSTWIYQVMVATGCAVGFASLFVLRTVPESGEGQAAAREPFFDMLRKVRREVSLGRLIPAWAGGLMAITLVAPFAILLVKNGYGIDDHTALFFTLVSLTGSVASGLVNRRLTERMKPHNLVTLYTGMLVAVAAVWSVAPSAFILPAVAGLFFLVGVSKAGIIVGLQHYLISENRPEHRIHVSLMAELTGAAIAGLSGTVIGGGLLAMLGTRTAGLELYRRYFLVTAGLLLVALFFVRRLRAPAARAAVS